MAYSTIAVKVFEEWKGSEALCNNAAKACLASIGKKESSNRAEVSHNHHEILAPILRHIGFLLQLFWH